MRFVLEGRVRRTGEPLPVTAQLIDATTGGHVWSERHDGQLEDVFDLQDEITRTVVASIRTSVHLSTIQERVERATRPVLSVWGLPTIPLMSPSMARPWPMRWNKFNHVTAARLSLSPNLAVGAMIPIAATPSDGRWTSQNPQAKSREL
ncbi:MAG: hypothetical protein AAGD47_13155 [Pseudomonadota bacterium]